MTRRPSVVMIGTRGLPARHGGFETAVSEIAPRLVTAGWDVLVYCRSRPTVPDISGVRLAYSPGYDKKTLDTLTSGMLAAVHASVRVRPDVCMVFNSGLAPAVLLLKLARLKVIGHPDGLEWKRSKWPKSIRGLFKVFERTSIALADASVADAQALAQYYLEEYGVRSEYIPYGSPPVARHPSLSAADSSLASGHYALVVARIEPENNVDLIVRGYLASSQRQPLVVVGSTPHPTEYSRAIESAAGASPNVMYLGGVYDQKRLDALYANAASYWHGHSVGGTNPSLLRAMATSGRVYATDNVFNREVLGGGGSYFATVEEAAAQFDSSFSSVSASDTEAIDLRHERLARRYTWDGVARAYDALFRVVLAGEFVKY